MRISKKLLALAIVSGALAVASVALAAGLTIKTTPTHVKVGKKVEMLVTGLKANEKVKVVHTPPAPGAKQVLYPRAGHTGALLVTVRKATIKGKHVWKFTGRQSHRSGTTHYVVK